MRSTALHCVLAIRRVSLFIVKLHKTIKLKFILIRGKMECNVEIEKTDKKTAIILGASVPARPTSVSSERLFSKAGSIISDRRSNLTPQHAEQLCFLSNNWSDA